MYERSSGSVSKEEKNVPHPDLSQNVEYFWEMMKNVHCSLVKIDEREGDPKDFGPMPKCTHLLKNDKGRWDVMGECCWKVHDAEVKSVFDQQAQQTVSTSRIKEYMYILFLWPEKKGAFINTLTYTVSFHMGHNAVDKDKGFRVSLTNCLNFLSQKGFVSNKKKQEERKIWDEWAPKKTYRHKELV